MSVRARAGVGLLAAVSLVGCGATSDQAAPSATASGDGPSAPSVAATPTASPGAPSSTGASASATAGGPAPSTPARATPDATADSTPDAGPGRAAPEPEPSQDPGFESVAAAVESLLQSRGAAFAGPCDEAGPDDVGAYCYVVAEDRGDEVVVTVGQVYSEFDAYLLLRLGETGWQLVDTADYPYPDGGPPPF